MDYVAVDAEENRELVAQYKIFQAPSLVDLGGENPEVVRGLSSIKGWVTR